MNFSFKIGNAFGIPVRIHATFLLLVWLLWLVSPEPLWALGLTAMCFGCVLLHELGHSLVARGFGLRVADITLWPLGGIARMSEIPENARIEALIAIAGPAVNFALVGLALLALVVAHALGVAAGAPVDEALNLFALANLLQGGFNLLPAFPMDGGRLLRAFLGRKRDWLAATETAVRTGRWVALALFLLALFMLRQGSESCMLPLIALFVWFEGTRELWQVRMRHGVLPFGARFAFGAGMPPASAAAPAPQAGATPPPPEPVERGIARRPLSWLQRRLRRGGFNEDEVRWLEAYRGPLRRPPEEP